MSDAANEETEETVSRREFARQVALGAGAGAGTVVLPLVDSGDAVLAAADDAKMKPTAKTKPKSSQPKDLTPAELLLEVVKKQYPHQRLDEKVLKNIVSDIRSDQFRSRVLSRFALKNSDEPGFVFAAFRADDV